MSVNVIESWPSRELARLAHGAGWNAAREFRIPKMRRFADVLDVIAFLPQKGDEHDVEKNLHVVDRQVHKVRRRVWVYYEVKNTPAPARAGGAR